MLLVVLAWAGIEAGRSGGARCRRRWGVRGGACEVRGVANLPSSLPAPTLLDQQTWQAREIFSDGSARDAELVWSELRKRVSRTDARLLLRTSALDLAIRERCVVFDFGVIRGYAERDRAVLLLEHDDETKQHRPTRATALVVESAVREALAKRAAQNGHGLVVEASASFALVVVEGVLEEAYEHTLRQFVRLDVAIRDELAAMTEVRGPESSRGASLYRLLPLEMQLRDEAVRGRRVYAIIADALRDEAFTSPAKDHVLLGPNPTPDDVELAESVFENALCRWEYVNDAIEKLVATIDATRKLVELSLDNERNRIERMDIYLNIAGLGLALISAVGGFFGMNLLIGLETHPHWFNRVVAATLLAAALLCHVCFRRFHAGNLEHADHVVAMVCALRHAPTLLPNDN